VWSSWAWATGGVREAGHVMDSEACAAEGCDATGVRCNYVDRRSRQCRTTWCARHWAVALGKPYCRRHASVVSGMAGGISAAGLPEVNSRGAALVGWVAGQLDSRVREALHQAAPPGGAVLVVDPVQPRPAYGRASHRWQRAWKLVDHTGVLKRVAIEVDEADDAEVIAQVDAAVVGHGVPPWIARRRQGVSVAPLVDAEQRRVFYDEIARSIELVVTLS